MGKETDAAGTDMPEYTELLDNLKDQLLVVLIRRLGGSVSIPMSEIDDTGGWVGLFQIEEGMFNFELKRTQ